MNDKDDQAVSLLKGRKGGSENKERKEVKHKYDLFLTSKGILLILHRTDKHKADDSSVVMISPFVRNYTS